MAKHKEMIKRLKEEQKEIKGYLRHYVKDGDYGAKSVDDLYDKVCNSDSNPEFDAGALYGLKLAEEIVRAER